MDWRNKFKLIFVDIIINFSIFIIFSNNLKCAEILFEARWSRIVTGDRAASLTREIGEYTQPTVVAPAAITAIMSDLEQPVPTDAQVQAWCDGLKQYGWAQQENEPEYENYLVIQIFVGRDGQHQLTVRQFGLLGKILEATFSLTGNKLQFNRIAIPQDLDRTLFITVRSPANFILNQEHFQKHFFEGMLNLDYPGLESAKKAYKEKKILLAAQQVAEYFRRQQHPAWPCQQPEKTMDIDEPAEKILKHEFSYGDEVIQYQERIDWYNNPVVNSEWLWSLNRMYHWLTLLHGYLNTANETYAREFNSQVIDWVVRNPAPAFRLTRTPAWRNLEAGVRMANTWPASFFGFTNSASFQTHTIQLMLASIWSHAEHISRFPSGMRFVNNWVITESSGLAIAGMSFPEFQNASRWVDTGFDRLSEQLNRQVYPDGMQHELASSYHISCLHSFQNAFQVAQKTGHPVPDLYQSIMEKMVNYLMYVCTPTRETPPTNDGNRNNVTTWLQQGAEQFKRPDFLYVATLGQQGQMPEHTSHFFDWGGHAIMKSDWSDSTWYLFFDVGPSGVSHQHEDKLHIDVSAYGRDFLTDGGKGTYIPDKWRDYFVSSAAHNTIMIDGAGQNRIQFSTSHRSDQPLTGQWFSDDQLDFACGHYSWGYGNGRIPVNHSRYVIFKKQNYWLVLDYLQGNGQHQFDLLYHFTPSELAVDTKNLSVKTLHTDGKNLQLVVHATVPATVKIVKGQENPVQGWISTGGAGRIAVPTAIFSGKARLPILLATVVQPFIGNNYDPITITFGKSPGYQATVTLQSDFGTDRWIVNLDNTKRISINGAQEELRLAFTRKKNKVIIEEMKRKF